MLTIDPSFRRESHSGNDCHFIKSLGKGIKFYQKEEDRDSSYMFQNYLHSKGLAPRTYFKCEARCRNVPLYAFETEVAEMPHEDGRSLESKVNLDAIYNYLQEELEKVGVHYSDWIRGNIGYIKGKPVVIDCGYPMEFIGE